ncbi:MAG: hypothetical protein QGG69_01030 [Kiritimatiellia bacterium]|nr:hypothetical protein [Kiritimatiellia bacterium]
MKPLPRTRRRFVRLGRYALLLALTIHSVAAEATSVPKTLRRVSTKAYTEPRPFDQNIGDNTGWHSHNKAALVEGTFLGVKNNNRALIKEADGDVVEVPLFHFTARDLGYILNRMAKFPEEVLDIERTPDEKPLLDMKTADLPLGPLESWKNNGALGGAFHSMNKTPIVEEINGRKGVRFDYSRWYIDPEYNGMTADVLAPKSLAEGKPFTLSTWICHPEKPDWDDPEVLMSWHSLGGNHGTSIDWKLSRNWGSCYIAGLGGDFPVPGRDVQAPVPEWTHMAYVYTGGIEGEFKVYENGVLKHTVKYDRLPELAEPTEITSTSVTLNGQLNTAGGEQAYVVTYLGLFDSHYWMQHRHIGMWEHYDKVGWVNPGPFSSKIEGLEPGRRYYYRMLACGDTDYANYGNQQRRWANGVGSFVTATADGKPGKILPRDDDQHLFMGVHWGSRWYTAYDGPSGWYRGYIGDTRLYDRALDDLDVRREADLTSAFGASPADGSDYNDTKVALSWMAGSKGVAKYRVYLSPDKAEVENSKSLLKEVTAEAAEDVELKPGRIYYWRVDQLDAAGKIVVAGDLWSFRVTRGQAFEPFPEDGSTVNLLGDFRWKDDSDAKERRLYIAETEEAVLAATEPRAKVGRNSYNNIRALKPGRTYYWRIECVQQDDTVTPGDVWSFTTKNYFTAEADVPVSEPYFDEIEPGRPGARVMEGMGHPSISTPGADEDDLWAVTYGTSMFLRKSADLRRQYMAGPWGSTVGTFEGKARPRGFNCGSYGGIPNWGLQLHEMGHQLHNGLNAISDDFDKRLLEVFIAHGDNNAWLGDYASANIGENMAVCAHQYVQASGREDLLTEDREMYFLLAEYLPGALAVELHPADGLAVSRNDTVTRWENRGGLVNIQDLPDGTTRPVRDPESTGAFENLGDPSLETIDGVTAVLFDGDDAMLWNLDTKQGFQDNREWSVELWVNCGPEADGTQTILGWGPDSEGARLKVGPNTIAYQLNAGISGEVSGVALADGWHHVAWVFESGGLDDTEGKFLIYVDGKEIQRAKHKLALKPNVRMFVGGGVTDGQVVGGFKGAVAHVRAYNYDIDHEQVENHFADELAFYQRRVPPHVGGKLYVDIDTRFLSEVGAEYHRPLYSKRMNKPWLRSAANHGTLQGRIHNDIHSFWHYSGSAPKFQDVAGIPAPYFDGMDRMIGVIDAKGSAAAEGPVSGTLEAWVYSDAQSSDEVVLEWGKSFQLGAAHLQPGWQHMAMVFKGEAKKGKRMTDSARVSGKTEIYRNGQKVGEQDGVLWADDGDYLHLGGHYDRQRWNWRKSFNGAIAVLRVHQLALTAEQLAENSRNDFIAVPHKPVPADRGMAVASRRPALSWGKGLAGGDKEQVYLGDAPNAVKPVGVFAPGEFRPELAPGKVYYWRAGNGPLWSFTTREGVILDLEADQLSDGKLAAWNNRGKAGGTFVPATLGTTFALTAQEFRGRTGVQLAKGLRLESSFAAPDCLTNGPFTIYYDFGSRYGAAEQRIVSWGEAPDSTGIVLSGASGRPCLEWGKQGNRGRGEKSFNYPIGNAGLVCQWMKFAVTYENGIAKLYRDGRLLREEKVDYGIARAGRLTIGDAGEYGILRELRIFDKALSAGDIKKLTAGESAATRNLQVAINVGNARDGEAIGRIENTGKLNGQFGMSVDIDRSAEVKTLGGRKAVVFNGKAMLQSDITLPKGLTDDHPFTIEMWAYCDEDGDARLFAMNKEVARRHVSLGFGGRQRKALVKPSRAGVAWNTNRDVTGKWTHLAWVYDGGARTEVRVYRDGKLDGKSDFATMDTIGGYPMTIGGMLNPTEGAKYMFKGAIADLKAYDYPRTAAELERAAQGAGDGRAGR